MEGAWWWRDYLAGAFAAAVAAATSRAHANIHRVQRPRRQNSVRRTLDRLDGANRRSLMLFGRDALPAVRQFKRSNYDFRCRKSVCRVFADSHPLEAHCEGGEGRTRSAAPVAWSRAFFVVVAKMQLGVCKTSFYLARAFRAAAERLVFANRNQRLLASRCLHH